MQKNIVLTGFMGTGKSVVARELGRLLGRRVVEIDREIEKSAGMTINEIFERYGESYFRDIESEIVRRISSQEGLIMSTGGGVVLRKENMDALRKKGVIVCLSASVESIIERTAKAKNRPLLNVPEPRARIIELLEQRKPYYQNCDIAINTEGKTPLQIAEEIIKELKERGL